MKVIKYQVRYNDRMINKPMSKVLYTLAEAQKAFNEAYEEILNTWATPDTYGLYIAHMTVRGHILYRTYFDKKLKNEIRP